ncbi:MAG: ATP-grasp domain-containing protein [Candidatus Zixiibacteriota bacterium]
MADKRILVVGTTYDYVDQLNISHPGKSLFLIDPTEASKLKVGTNPNSLIVCNLKSFKKAAAAIKKHLSLNSLELSGITSFDCESLALTAKLAEFLKLRYLTSKSIAICRNKYLTKEIWEKAGVNCPRSTPIKTVTEGLEFLEKTNGPVVLKPLTGSGSELVFLCRDRHDLMDAYLIIRSQMIKPVNPRMYSKDDSRFDPKKIFEIEEYINGREYSCDFFVNDDEIKIIRIAKKIPAENKSFGTTLAYSVPARLPEAISESFFLAQLKNVARSLDLNHAICMVDFIIKGDLVYFLEISPRPGGDCLPMLIKKSSGLDMLGLAMELAEKGNISIPENLTWKKLVGLRIFTDQEGTISSIDTQALSEDSKVEEIYIKYDLPFDVVLPPANYDSQILGHIIFHPNNDKDIMDECLQLRAKVKIVTEYAKWAKVAG